MAKLVTVSCQKCKFTRTESVFCEEIEKYDGKCPKCGAELKSEMIDAMIRLPGGKFQ